MKIGNKKPLKGNAMNKFNTLLVQYCPYGVKFEKIGSLGYFFSGLTAKSKNDFTDGNARYISYMTVFSNPSINFVGNDYVKVMPSENQNSLEYGDVIFTGSSETPEECGMSSVVTLNIQEKLYLNSFCFGFRLNDRSLFIPDFLKHLFRSHSVRQQINQTANGVTRFNISKKKFGEIKVPIPPLPIQQEIVNILDKFTQLETELEAELEARKVQYEYYRNELLSFDEKHEWRKLGDLCTINTGSRPSESISSIGNYPYINAGTTPSGYISIGNTTSDCITIPSRGQGGAGYIGYQKTDFWNGPLSYAIRSKTEAIQTKFIYFYLKSIQNQIIELRQTGSIPAINRKELIKVLLPVPSKIKQKQIVSTLDKFDKLINDLSSGIPAEINARRKQYEYYRERLLTFKPLADG